MRTFLALGLLFAATIPASAQCVSYTYCEFWGGQCQTDTPPQSPIASDKACRHTVTLNPVDVHYRGRTVNLKVLNTGVNLKSTPQLGPRDQPLRITVDGHDYTLDEFHFHTPPEHVIDLWHKPRRAVAELHLVHHGNKVVALAVPIYEGQSNAALAALLAGGRPQRCNFAMRSVPVGALIPLNSAGKISEYITYGGSLTTPPCEPAVTFILLEHGITATAAQINLLKVAMNARPAQYNGTDVNSSTGH
jgi:carbonic anhydrase